MKIARACLVGLVLSGAAWAEPVVEGRVRLASGEAAVGAQVLVFDLADLSRWVGATTDESGQFVVSLGALGSGQVLPAGFGLGQNYPNPFNPGTVIPYQLATDGYVRLDVFNLLGQRVVTLVDGEMSAGRYTAQWDARDGSGYGVAAGVYVYRLTAGGGTATRRMVLVDGSAGMGAGGMGPTGGLVNRAQDAPVYGLTVSGVGVETYVDAAFHVGDGPVEVVVAAAMVGRGKVAAEGILGDVNNDGKVDVTDALLVTQYSGDSSLVMPNGGDISLGDVNGDGVVNLTDGQLLLAYAANSSDPSLPAGIGQPVEEAVNQAPVLKRIGDQSVAPGGSLTFELVASDPDGDALTYRVRGNPTGSSLSGATFRWPSVGTAEVSHEVTFTVTDGRGGRASETVTLRVVEFRFNLIRHQIETEWPSFVNILFQVTDEDDQGVPFLTADHFEVRENDQVISPSESAMYIRKREAGSYSYGLKTVLMLDTSVSIRAHLAQIKEAALTLVRNRIPEQEIAVYEFSEEPVLLQDFTTDVDSLVAAIEGVRLGFATTNLYGSIIEGSGRWRDVYTTTEVRQGFMILLTDGSDTQGSSTLSRALSARGDKQVYTIGLGNEIEPDVLRRLGNAGFFHIADVGDLAGQLADELADQFAAIQTELDLLANSFYWLSYLSPKRGDKRHTLELSLKGNRRNSTVRGNFNSEDFVSVRPGLTVNASQSRPEGIEELRLGSGQTRRLEVVTFFGTERPRYRWESSDEGLVTVAPDTLDVTTVRVTAVGDSGAVTLRVYDEANGFDREVAVEVFDTGGSGLEQVFSLPGGGEMEFVWIEPGVFQMGSPESEEGRWDREGPLHEVELSRGFWLGKYEVTQGQWEAVMGSRPWSGKDYVQSNSSHPAVYISWDDVQEFIEKLNAAVGSSVYRLPTEAEWEYACRAGTQTRWSFGDDVSELTDYAWYYDNAWDVGEGYAHAVGTKLPNGWGLYDMHGNVWEWVQDRYSSSYYNSSPRVDPLGPDTGSDRVIRGGDFYNSARNVRSANRHYFSPGDLSGRIGVRPLRISTP